MRHTCAMVATTTFRGPGACLPTRSRARSTCQPTTAGAEKIDPVELMFASDEGNRKFQGTPPVLRRRSGKFSVARGYSPMFWMHAHGVRWHSEETRGCVGPRSGARRRAGTRGAFASGCGPSQLRELPRLVGQATIQMEVRASSRSSSPQGCHFNCWWLRPNKLNYQTDFLEFPRRTCAVWSAKMPLVVLSVNLWKTTEVS